MSRTAEVRVTTLDESHCAIECSLCGTVGVSVIAQVLVDGRDITAEFEANLHIETTHPEESA